MGQNVKWRTMMLILFQKAEFQLNRTYSQCRRHQRLELLAYAVNEAQLRVDDFDAVLPMSPLGYFGVTFRETSDATALVENLTSTNNGLLSASEDQFEHNDGCAAAEAETSHGICHQAATKVGKKRVSTKSRIKGKQKDMTFLVGLILICPEGITYLGSTQEEAEVQDELAMNLGGRFFALPPQVKNTAIMLSPSSLNSYHQEGLAVTNSSDGFQFDSSWSTEQCIKYIDQRLPVATAFLHKCAEADPKGQPSLLTWITLPDGKDIYKCSQRLGRGYQGLVLILTGLLVNGTEASQLSMQPESVVVQPMAQNTSGPSGSPAPLHAEVGPSGTAALNAEAGPSGSNRVPMPELPGSWSPDYSAYVLQNATWDYDMEFDF
ncbi:hypothetical protein BT96DRAFT_1080972 [Gymnopus androsaceus JB14]|uniref:Uncharacterized protein n=1 Tax=Gymnopus androsaceus JB14 TaxID=1447944 RepID=A0A6A4GPN6_9AGAR|nr:hypothetical protein BT96DRAFT_1080972 [Gymnopus androsaceus JB14]